MHGGVEPHLAALVLFGPTITKEGPKLRVRHIVSLKLGMGGGGGGSIKEGTSAGTH